MSVQVNLSTLLKRLEAATSRLEDIATSQTSQSLTSPQLPLFGAAMAPQMTPAVSNASHSAPAMTQTLSSNNPSISAYQALIDGQLGTYLAKADPLGGVVAQQAALVQQVFQAQLVFLKAAAVHSKPNPTDSGFAAMLKQTQSALVAAQTVKDTDKSRKFMNHVKMVEEGIAALGWVTVEPAPAPYVKDMKESAEFYANRIAKEFKDSDPSQIEYSRAFMKLLDDLRDYVKQYHKTGVAWNPKGASPSTFSPSSASPAVSPTLSPQPNQSPSIGGVFSQISKGEGVTAGLKKVDDSQKTHKNPALRDSSPVVPPKPAPAPKPQSSLGNAIKKPAKTELDGNKWTIENHENNANIVIDQTALNQTVNIFGCVSSTIQIRGKVNAVSLVGCKKTSVLLESAVSTVSITSSPSFTVQITGKVPAVLIDATDGGQLFLSESSLETEVVTAKCSALNISLPVKGEEQGIFSEKAVPEQFKTIVKDGKLVTTVVEHSG